jgi:2-dehydro-3-deoxy-D-gluconate 5-dehydrogenase
VGILDMFRLDGKTALVTGARRGLGQAMAVALAEAGAGIVGISTPGTSHAETEKLVSAAGRPFKAYGCDLGDRKALYATIEDIRATCPPIDILVNNAGTILRKPAAEHPDEYWDTVLAVNLTAQFLLAREFGRAMVERRAGKVIFTASLLSFQGGITVPGYAASKSGVAALVRGLSNEWASKGVNVNGIAPGYMATDNTEALRADPVRSRQIMERIPAQRWGTAADMQGATVFLASAASDYVHGEILVIDGGWMGR